MNHPKKSGFSLMADLRLFSAFGLTVASRQGAFPKNNGPQIYVNPIWSREEKVRLGEDEMGWCRKDKFQQFPSTVHAHRLA
jgi:hypothetical protein